MDIIQITPTQLTLKDQNRQWFWGVLFSLPFVAVGLVVAAAAANVTTLACQRHQTQITCQRTITGLVGQKTTPLPGELIKANVVTAHGTGVVLATSTGMVELANHRTQVNDQHYKTANTINTFIHNPQQSSLIVRQDDRWQGGVFGAAFLLPGLAIMGVSLTIPLTVVCQFDKSSGQLMVKKRYRLVCRSTTTQVPLTQVKQAEVKQYPGSSRTPIYGIRLAFHSSDDLDLSPPTRDRAQCQRIADTINQFL